MKTFLAGLSLMFLLSIMACTHDAHDSHDSAQASDQIELNQGNKWKVNPEMTPYISAAERLLTEYVDQSQADYKALAQGLKSNNNKLIASCTMKGKSHDELHKWLYPHLQLVSKLDASAKEESGELIAQLEKSFETYHTYFE